MSLRLHGDTLAAPGMLDFAVNVWPAPRSPALQRALEAALAGDRYPDEAPARRAIAARHGRPAGEVLAANGACDVFWLLAHALHPGVAACVHPAFTEPERALRAAGARVVRVLRRPPAWAFDPADVPDDAELVVLGNPNNPTGGLDDPEAILALVRPGRLVVVDESFMDFAGDERRSLAARRDPGVAVVRSLTKLWSLAGVRAGYLVGSADLVARLDAGRQPWSVNALACAALEACAADGETPRTVAEQVGRARERLLDGLGSIAGVRAWPSSANFVLLHVRDGRTVVALLREAGIAVRPCGSFPGLNDDYIRVAVRSPADNDRLVAALREAVA